MKVKNFINILKDIPICIWEVFGDINKAEFNMYIEKKNLRKLARLTPNIEKLIEKMEEENN